MIGLLSLPVLLRNATCGCCLLAAGIVHAQTQAPPQAKPLPVNMATPVIPLAPGVQSTSVQATVEAASKLKLDPAKKDELSRKLEMRREELRHDGRCKKKEEKEKEKK